MEAPGRLPASWTFYLRYGADGAEPGPRFPGTKPGTALKAFFQVCVEVPDRRVDLVLGDRPVIERPAGGAPQATAFGRAMGFGERDQAALRRFTHRMPHALVEQVDSAAGRRHRTRFINQAVREKLIRDEAGERNDG
jgi:hypothetical protein